jgi:hypothetical protein
LSNETEKDIPTYLHYLRKRRQRNVSSPKGDLIEGTVMTEILSSRNPREKDRIGKSQPFRERIKSV